MTPKDALTQFSDAWNELRNAVLGRGSSKPENVPQALYDKVANTYERWRTYLASLPASMQVLPVGPLSQWVLDYRDLAKEAQAAGLSFTLLAPSWTEDIKTLQRDIHELATDATKLAKAGATMFGGVLVANTYERWRTYLASLPASMQVLPVGPLSQWVLDYRDLAKEAQAAGLSFTLLAPSWTEDIKTLQRDIHELATDATKLAKAGASMFGGVVVASLFLALIPIVALAVGGRRRR